MPHCSRREERARAAEAGRDLVADEQHVVLARTRAPRRASPLAVGEQHAGCALHERLDDHRRELGVVSRDERARDVEAAGSSNAGARTTGKRSGSKMSAPKPSSPTDSAPIVSPWYAPPKARNVRRRPSEVDPVLERDLQRLLDGRCAVGGVEEVRLVDRHDAARALPRARSPRGCRCRASSCARPARAARGSRRRARGRNGRAC